MSAETRPFGDNDQPALTIVYKPLEGIRPDPGNARTHSKRQVEQIVASIKRFGFTNPILIDETGLIIAGHGRLLAAKSLGLRDVSAIEVTHLTEIQKRALRLADNKIALNAGWDTDQLRFEIEQLSKLDVDFDLTVTGFSTGELDVLLEGAADPMDEVVTDLPLQPRAKVGDIWICGPHRIGCGDGRDIAFLSKIVGKGAKVDAAFLDPPYNFASTGMRMPRAGTGNLRWPPARWTKQSFGPS